ncbi:type I-E CRISPR-associated protein Cse1/CasA [Agromyces humi]|uniref:type I-E CRISPR-associated protein Cse1/CasA n=1 Tax=Agromyces humi TaxID=1766800 RepID=UPI001F267DFC|nr:type I-E CRISPR-associated protein Cse1/CasA [Agromyces humi]
MVCFQPTPAHVLGVKPSPRLSVRTVPCIPVRVNGRRQLLDLDATFARAHEIERLEIRDPLSLAAMIRFLVSVTVLVMRVAGADDAERCARDGFDPVDVADALDAVDEHLWLLHPDTPFLQCAELDLYDESDQPGEPASTLLPRIPGPASRAWFDTAGGPFTGTSLSPAEAFVALVTNWFYGCATNSWTFIDGKKMYRVGGSVGMYGAGDPEGVKTALTFFRSGASIAELLLANTHQHWVDDDTLPAWASPFRIDHPVGSLSEATFTASAALLQFNPTSFEFDTVLTGGFPSGLDKQVHSQAVAAQLRQAAENDPTRVWFTKQVKGRADLQLLFAGATRTNSTAQNLRAWHVDAASPELRHGLIHVDAGVDVLEVAAINKGVTSPTTATWFTIESGILDVDQVQRELIADIGNTAARNPEAALGRALQAVFPPQVGERGRTEPHSQYQAVYRAAVGHFHAALEPAIQEAVATIMAGGTPDGLLDRIREAKLAAFDRAVEPFFNTRTAAAIATGRASIASSFWRTPDGSDDAAVNRMVKKYLNASTVDLRADLARGLTEPGRDSLRARFRAELGQVKDPDRTLSALGIAAAHPKLIHSERSLPDALRRLSDLHGTPVEHTSGVPADVGQLIDTPDTVALPMFARLARRLENDMISVSIFDLVHTIRHWHDRGVRRDFAHTFFAPTGKSRP